MTSLAEPNAPDFNRASTRDCRGPRVTVIGLLERTQVAFRVYDTVIQYLSGPYNEFAAPGRDAPRYCALRADRFAIFFVALVFFRALPFATARFDALCLAIEAPSTAVSAR